SGHASMQDLDAFVEGIEDLKRVILVHGEQDQMEPFAGRIKASKPDLEIVMPEREEEITV
ncbi:MAG: hypothetical protein KAS32_27850, partial [Candidatus Peribacteraceae bacterium]|nr:hypothetical protein [Candidatus Peribacteraceae bacterium]